MENWKTDAYLLMAVNAERAATVAKELGNARDFDMWQRAAEKFLFKALDSIR